MAFGPALDSLDSSDSDQGPNLMHLTNLKVLACGPEFRCIRSIRFGLGSDSNASNESKSPGLLGDFGFIRSIRLGPGSASNAFNESKVLALVPT